MSSANDNIRDRFIAHAVFLERYKRGLSTRTREMLDRDVFPALYAALMTRVDALDGQSSTAALNALNVEIQAITAAAILKLDAHLVPELDALMAAELEWLSGVFKSEAQIVVTMGTAAPELLAISARGIPFNGLTLKQWFDTLGEATRRGITQAVQRGIVEGQGAAQIARTIRGTRAFKYMDGVFETTRRQAETIARTAAQHITNQARFEVYNANADIIAKWQFVATLDSRTSITCASLDGKTFALKKGPRPPLHPNCRSKSVPILKKWGDLPPSKRPQGTRASIDGQVPASTTYGQWLKKQSASVQEAVLGKTRAKLFRDGGLKIEQFVNKDYSALTLSQMITAEKAAFIKAGIDLN